MLLQKNISVFWIIYYDQISSSLERNCFIGRWMAISRDRQRWFTCHLCQCQSANIIYSRLKAPESKLVLNCRDLFLLDCYFDAWFLWLSRYVDRYVPPAAHTPTDRYVPTSDPGDPYMRRDLGFHHHYRLPPPAAYPYQTHFRFRGFAYTTSGRLGGSPGSSSSSSTTSNQRETFATSPLLRPKVRASAVEFGAAAVAATVGGVTTTTTAGVSRHACASSAGCCGDASANTRACCQMRRSLPPGTLPAISTQTSSW